MCLEVCLFCLSLTQFYGWASGQAHSQNTALLTLPVFACARAHVHVWECACACVTEVRARFSAAGRGGTSPAALSQRHSERPPVNDPPSIAAKKKKKKVSKENATKSNTTSLDKWDIWLIEFPRPSVATDRHVVWQHTGVTSRILRAAGWERTFPTSYELLLTSSIFFLLGSTKLLVLTNISAMRLEFSDCI